MHYKHVLILFLAMLGLFPASAFAQPQQKWVQLGCKEVNLGGDRDVIPVAQRDRFSAIRLRARGNSVEMHDLKVVYGNGERDDIRVRRRIPEGGNSGSLDLHGDARQIDRIEMAYARAPNFRGRAAICVEGLVVRTAGPPPAEWVQLGCRDVDLNVDRDVVEVSRRDGRFTAIRLRAIGNAVQMIDLKVLYGNGEPDDIRVRGRIPQGGSTGPLDLRGHDRSIDRIQMVYARVPNFRGRAAICVDGKPA